MEQLKEIVSTVLNIDREQIHDNLTADDVDTWDSISHLQLVSEIEKQFNISLNLQEVTAMESFGKIKEVLDKK